MTKILVFMRCWKKRNEWWKSDANKVWMRKNNEATCQVKVSCFYSRSTCHLHCSVQKIFENSWTFHLLISHPSCADLMQNSIKILSGPTFLEQRMVGARKHVIKLIIIFLLMKHFLHSSLCTFMSFFYYAS